MILTLNVGSSSIKLALFENKSFNLIRELQLSNTSLATDVLKQFVNRSKLIKVIHRIVHGGTRTTPCIISSSVEKEIQQASVFAPLHNLAALKAIQLIKETFGDSTLQIAVFDTDFFSNLPPIARTYAISQEIIKKHNLFRRGFHGLAHESIWLESQRLFPSVKKMITLQLGSGCSASAIIDGAPVDTSMGFSPLEGLIMSTRPGDLDSGILIHLLKQKILSLEELESELNYNSGLLGLSQQTSNMKKLLESTDPQSQFAVEVFCQRIRKYIGAYWAIIGGADLIAFAGGIGFNSKEIQHKVLSNFDCYGIVLGSTHTKSYPDHSHEISHSSSKTRVFAIKVNEENLMLKKAANI